MAFLMGLRSSLNPRLKPPLHVAHEKIGFIIIIMRLNLMPDTSLPLEVCAHKINHENEIVFTQSFGLFLV